MSLRTYRSITSGRGPFARVPLLVAALASGGAPAAQSLSVDTASIALDRGGTQNFTLTGGASWAGFPYLLLGTGTGTSPGFSLGGFQVPLNVDAYFRATLESPFPILTGSFALLDGGGNATAALTLPPCTDPALVGLTFHHAYAVINPTFDGLQGVSNPAAVLLSITDSMFITACSLGCTSGYCGAPVTCTASTVPAAGPITVTFSEDVDVASVNLISFQIADLVTGIAPPGQFSLQGTDTLVFTPTTGLVPGTSYSIRVPGSAHDPGLLYIQSVGGVANLSSLDCVVTAQ
jgi:hypothetical protein